ncbi:MAG: aminotransferase class V-fold PLP-dependent enzyme [Candidatus Woesearchaeota archaeon]
MKDFDILKNISYLDNASSTQKPKVVIDAVNEFYSKHYSNTHRGIYELSEKATDLFEESRKKVASFINAEPKEIVFVRGATEGFNNLARTLKGKSVLLTEIEHHSNYLPWKQFFEVNSVKYNKDLGCLDWIPFSYGGEDIVSFTFMSNVSGEILDVKKIVKELRAKNPDVIIVVDACQAVSHTRIDVKDLDVDFLVFSSHKMYGPTGVGVVFGKKDLLEKLDPFMYGGNMVLDAINQEWASLPFRHEAGTMHGAGVYGLGVAVDYLLDGFEDKIRKEKELQSYLVEKLRAEKIGVIGHTHEGFGPVVSFVLDIHAHDLASFCNKHNVCIRAGHHCAQPFMKALNVVSTARASLSFYNTKEDVDKLILSIKDARRVING